MEALIKARQEIWRTERNPFSLRLHLHRRGRLHAFLIPRRAYPLERPCIATHNRETATLVTAKNTVAHLNEAFRRAPFF